MTKKKQKGKAGKAASVGGEPEVIKDQAPGNSGNDAGTVRYGPVKGLDNLGNTCFLNSALQMLQSAPQLRSYFGVSAEEMDAADGPLGEGIRAVFMDSMKDPSDSCSGNYKFRSDTYNPQPLLSAICEIAPQFKGRDQHDSHELLRFLIDGLQSEEEKLSKAKTEIMKRATDVEEGLIFRRMSSTSDSEEVLALLEDVADLDVFQEKFRNSLNRSREGSVTLQGGDDSHLPDPVFGEEGDDSHLPPSDPVFADEEDEEEDAKEEGMEEVEDPKAAGRASMAALARSASLKALKRSLTAPAATANKSVLEDASTPASLIAQQTADRLLKRTMSASTSSSRASSVGSRRRLSSDFSNMPSIHEDFEAHEEEEGEDESKPASFIQTVFGGTLTSTVKCEGCDFESITREPFLDISIPVPSGLRSVKRPNFHKVEKYVPKPHMSAKEMKRLSKEAKKKDKMERKKAQSAKQELEFELLLTPEQASQEEGTSTGGGKQEDGGGSKAEGAATAAVEEPKDGTVAGEEAVKEGKGMDVDLAEAMDALAGCTMEASDDDTVTGGDPGKLPEWNPEEGEFSVFDDHESSLTVSNGPPPAPKFVAEEADEEEAEGKEDVNLITCLESFFKPEHIDWQCPKESGKEGKEDGPSAAPVKAPPPAAGRKLSRRVSFAGSDGEPEVEEPPRRGIKFSTEAPTIYKIPGSEEQRGTDFDAAMKGQATFNKPFKYSGNDFIARVRLDTWSFDRLDVLIGPNWDEDAEDMWPEEQKVADVQIDEISPEDQKKEEMQILLQCQAQLLLDCFSDLFMCQGPVGLLNILRAGFVTLEERGGPSGEQERWVVVGRFPPGQIGGAKEWVYPPNSEASRELFATMMPSESPLPSPSPQRKSPLKNPNFTKTLRSSLKKPDGTQLVTAGLSQLKITKDDGTFEKLPSITSPLATSPSIQHFPPKAAFPSIDERAAGDSEDDREEEEEEEAVDKPADAAPFDWSTFDGTNAPPGSRMKSFEETCRQPAESDGDAKKDAGGGEEADEEEEQKGPQSALTSALAKGSRIEGKQIRRQRPSKDGVEGGATDKSDVEPTPEGSPIIPQPTPRKSGLKKSVHRPAIKSYRIHRAPELLTVHLKRFHQDIRGRLQKISGALPFDFELDLAPFCDPSGPDKDGARYELVGVVEHSGTLRGGHYVAYVRRTAEVVHAPDDERYPAKWHYVSDSHTRPVDRSEVENAEAYMLLYVRRP